MTTAGDDVAQRGDGDPDGLRRTVLDRGRNRNDSAQTRMVERCLPSPG